MGATVTKDEEQNRSNYRFCLPLSAKEIVNKPRRRVVHVIGQLRPGGIETWLLNVMKCDRALREMSAICCVNRSWDGPCRTQFEQLDIPILICPLDYFLVSFVRSFSNLVQQGKFDIVHSHLAGMSGAVSFAAFLGGSPKRISHYHNVPLPGHRASWYRRVYLWFVQALEKKYSTDVVGITRHVLEHNFGTNMAGNPNRRLICYGVPLPSTVSEILDPGLRQHLGIPPHARVVGHVGRFEAQKNHDFIVDLAAYLIPQHPDIYFLLVGDGPLRATTQHNVQSRGLNRRVIFTGVRQDVLSLMRNVIDVFLFPSLFEGLGLVMIEAQAVGLRCLASSAVPEEVVVVPEAVQFLPLSADREVWGKTLVSLLSRGHLDAMYALTQVRNSRFSMDTCLNQLHQLYERS